MHQDHTYQPQGASKSNKSNQNPGTTSTTPEHPLERLAPGRVLSPADIIQLQNTIGNRALSQMLASRHNTGPANPVSSGGVIQCALGVEAELNMPVEDEKANPYKGDIPLAKHDKFKVVTDHRTLDINDKKLGYSNLELVSEPFGHLDNKNGINSIQKDRIDTINAMQNASKSIYYKNKKDDSYKNKVALSQALGTGYKGIDQNAQVNPGKIPTEENLEDNLFVQYTLGVGLDQIPDLMSDIIDKKGRNTKHKIMALKSLKAAEDAMKVLENAKYTSSKPKDLKGYLSLVYMHAQAFENIVENSVNKKKVQPKNTIPALSRVPLGNILTNLLPGDKDALKKNSDSIFTALANHSMSGKWNKEDTRQVGNLDEVSLSNYMKSALGEDDSISQQQVFGGMHEMDTYDKDTKGNARLIPLELRSIGKPRVQWQDVQDTSQQLLDWSYQQDQKLYAPKPLNPIPKFKTSNQNTKNNLHGTSKIIEDNKLKKSNRKPKNKIMESVTKNIKSNLLNANKKKTIINPTSQSNMSSKNTQKNVLANSMLSLKQNRKIKKPVHKLENKVQKSIMNMTESNTSNNKQNNTPGTSNQNLIQNNNEQSLWNQILSLPKIPKKKK